MKLLTSRKFSTRRFHSNMMYILAAREKALHSLWSTPAVPQASLQFSSTQGRASQPRHRQSPLPRKPNLQFVQALDLIFQLGSFSCRGCRAALSVCAGGCKLLVLTPKIKTRESKVDSVIFSPAHKSTVRLYFFTTDIAKPSTSLTSMGPE